jgi:hypothetical protein
MMTTWRPSAPSQQQSQPKTALQIAPKKKLIFIADIIFKHSHPNTIAMEALGSVTVLGAQYSSDSSIFYYEILPRRVYY